MKKYPGCSIFKDNKGNFQIAWYSANPDWDNGIEWLATFREEEDAQAFLDNNGGDTAKERKEWSNL